MKTLKFILPAMGVLCLSACSDSNVDTPDEMTQKEQTLKAITIDYVENNVRKTYAAMADASIELLSLCETMQEKHTAGTLATADIQAAGEAWKRARKSWELSEAFLFGPAANHNIDPHIDSWPLDKAAMDSMNSFVCRKSSSLSPGSPTITSIPKNTFGRPGASILERI